MTPVRTGGLTALLCWTLAACAPPVADDTVPSEPSGTEAVVLTVAPTSVWRELRIDGTTDLPDGTVLSYRVTHALATELPPSEWPAQNLMADGTAVVLGGQYGARLNTTYWPKGNVLVEVQFPVAAQPPDITKRYGAFGEQLTGDNVTALGSSKVATAAHTFEWTR
jgi:hypothetical protein